ncbi:hypothetical protein Tsubulata_008336 [Turnera subulata]|uniref:DUF309 domain-containing protein n=1 Tax=Turnera subulata TaxID=218843 RepID=A0A9Q0FV54_9ROSI|nr:hypothetical protein Tsubulata_008336 [Turnera subulata]
MANTLKLLSLPLTPSTSNPRNLSFLSPFRNLSKFSSLPPPLHSKRNQDYNVLSSTSVLTLYTRYSNSLFRICYRYYNDVEDDDDNAEDCSFERAVALFNNREYYKCHDLLEALWIKAEEPSRTLFHGILQCAVGFHHLFNKNHKGAMMELGEGLCKLKKMNFESGPFHQFEREISATLEFIYQTQIELAACSNDLCLAMDQSERSYQLLGGYAAGQHLYSLQNDQKDDNVTYIVFSTPQPYYVSSEPPKVKLPTLSATEEHLMIAS